MTDWQEATNLLKVNGKKNKSKKEDEIGIGQRCWECGLYINNLSTGHYCMKCLIKHLKKLGIIESSEPEKEKSKEKAGQKKD